MSEDVSGPILSAAITTSTGGGRAGDRPLTANRHKRMTGAQGAAVIRRWRDAAAAIWTAEARRAGIDRLPSGLAICARPVYAGRNYHPDVGALQPTLKAAIDGLRRPTPAEAKRGIVGADLIPDDTPEWVEHLHWLPATAGHPAHGIDVRIFAGVADMLSYLYDGADLIVSTSHGPSRPATASDGPAPPFGGDAATLAARPAAEVWTELRDTALHATDLAWQFALDYQRRASMRALATLTGIARPTLIRWCNWSPDDRSTAHDPASQLLKMLHPDRYDNDMGAGERGQVQHHTPAVANGGPWPIIDSAPEHAGFLTARSGRWSWLCGCGATGGVRAGAEHLHGGGGSAYGLEAEARDGYWGHLDDDGGGGGDDDSF